MSDHERVTVEIPQDEVFTRVGRFTLGFLESVGNDALKLCGSGTLVRLGAIAGVVTCAHVVERIFKNKDGEVGILSFPVRRQQFQSIKIGLPLLESLTLEARPWTMAGPDIAFIKLPSPFVSQLENYATVLSLDKQLEQRNLPEPIGTVRGELVAGVIDQWTAPPVATEHTKAIMHNCLLNTGDIEGLPSEGGYDRIEFTPDPTDQDRPPDSYAGSSGGGLWRIWIKPQSGDHTTLADRRLIGVAYFEIPTQSNSMNIICHGPSSLYDRLVPAIFDKWPESQSQAR